MIQGATIRCPSPIRTPAERITIDESQNQVGNASARARTAATALMSGDDACFACPLRELAPVLETDLGCRLGESPKHFLVHPVGAGGFFERTHVRVGCATEVVLAPHVLA